MKKRKLFYIASILLLLSGCYDDISDILNDAPINKDGSIAFRTDSILTRGTPQDNLEAYDAVHLMVYSHQNAYSDDPSLYRQTELKKSKSADTPPVWEYSPHMFWPEGRKLSFLAYAIEKDIKYATTTGEEGVFIRENAEKKAPTIEYSVPTDVTLQPDLLVTALLNHEKVNNVTLPMKHALSCVSFCATGPKNMKVKSLKLNKVYSKGTFKLDDPSITWTLDPDSKNPTVLEPGINPDIPLEENPTKDDYLMTKNGYLMMIPQELKDATIDVIYKDTVNKKEITTQYTLPTTIVWEPGKKYIYKFGEDFEEVVVYYEKYSDGSYGFQWDKAGVSLTRLDDTETKSIVEAGYGVLTKNRLISNDTPPTIKLGADDTLVPTVKVSSVSGGYNLYAVNQTSINRSATFTLPKKPEPIDVYFDGNAASCGKIIPHFAKGVTIWIPESHAIRTPQQMQNISVLTAPTPYGADDTSGITLKQERDIDFSVPSIGGGGLSGAVVDETFSGIYEGESKTISNVTISAPGADYIGLFSQSVGKLNNIVLKSSSISGGSYVGGIVGYSYGDNAAISKPRIIGTENTAANQINISGVSYVGGIVGYNKSTITGNVTEEPATEITVAEVSGWVNIIGSDSCVGGITGFNGNWNINGSINTVLVNGVFVNGSSQGNLTESKITIKGKKHVGGVVGWNETTVNGNVTGSSGKDIKNMPDVAGIVEITGTSSIGGIAGINAQLGTLNSVNIRLGRPTPMIISGTGDYVGGIVGDNRGKLGTISNNTFISTRGNIKISGANYIGGIVGSNSSNAELENCFVYDFYTQIGARSYYAPKITATGTNAGGIAGSNASSITNCSVFSASNTLLLITAGTDNAGGIAGGNASGGNTTGCSLVGKIQIEAKANRAGGVFGDNKSGTKITTCWVGSSDGNNIIAEAQKGLGLVITPPGVSTPSYGTPFITGNNYIGGIVGLNDGGEINNIQLKDNVIIGRAETEPLNGSNFVGGITGGNTIGDGTTPAKVIDCRVENVPGKKIIIQGSSSLGGVVGVNNGVVQGCTVSASAEVDRFTISGLGTIGGIIGQNGGHYLIKLVVSGKETAGTGNDHTMVTKCKVIGYITIKGNGGGYDTATDVGGIIGLNGPTRDDINNVSECAVEGATDAGSIIISVGRYAGGIAGGNSGNINLCTVKNATVESASDYNGGYAGGIAGQTSATAQTFNPETDYRSNIKSCTVYPNVTITGANSSRPSGALVGYLNSTVSIILGTNAQNKVSNSNKVIVDGSPVTATSIVGFATGGATINGVITTVP